MKSGEVRVDADDAVGIAAERSLNLNCGARTKISTGSLKIIESPDVSPITSFAGSGSLTPIQFRDAIDKFFKLVG